jgi:hypothetical protein
MVAPKIIFASVSTDSVIIFAASSTSNILKSVPHVILKRSPFAPAIESSKSGESMADLAASEALFSHDPYQIPIRAEPAFLITDLTSAKSTLISPGFVIKSETHCTH